jgi:hypothetical protein
VVGEGAAQGYESLNPFHSAALADGVLLPTRENVVLSAWGEKAGWYRNIEAVPALEVRTGTLSFPQVVAP